MKTETKLQTLRREAALAQQVRDKMDYLAVIADQQSKWAQATFDDALQRYEAEKARSES